ncbi:concanavalin A-like lectin/glucanase domain-containing protein [Rhizophagus diaphanus]|nr:concanavalin A-like lectin/glucanase domain-containing protein [Rhizophagus diaphanus] [Rhizophagus sp. MUCL 43196]
MPFVTPEYEVFRYSAILVAKQVSNDAYNSIINHLPTLDQIENSMVVEIDPITDHQKIAEELKPLIKFIDFRRIKVQIISDIIEPLGIIPIETTLSVYRYMALSINLNLSNTRAKPINLVSYYYVFDVTACGSKLIIEDNGKIVHAPNGHGFQSVRAKIALENKGIFEWDVIIEKTCGHAWVGVCASENFNYETFAGSQPTGWVLGSSGYFGNSSKGMKYCPPFGDGTIVTVHLDMNKRTCAFTVNGTKYPQVSAWNNLPSKLYPVVSLSYPGRFRIQPHQKN